MGIIGAMEITTRVGCKNMCVYCPQDKFIKAYKKRSDVVQMSLDTFKTCLDKIPHNIHIHFSGMAEPWLNPNCTDMILYAHKCGFEIAVFTTTTGMSLTDIDLIKHIPFRTFEVHLPDDKNYTNIKVDKEYLLKIHKLSASNIHGINYMSIGGVHPEIKKILSGIMVREDELVDRAGNVNGIVGINKKEKLKGKIICIGCGKILNHNVLLPNGDVILCCMDYGLQHVLGNLLLSDYEPLFNSDEYQKIIRGLDDSMDILCRYCSNAKQTELRYHFLRNVRRLKSKYRYR